MTNPYRSSFAFFAVLTQGLVGWIGGVLGRRLVDQFMPQPTSLYEQDLHTVIREFWVGYPLGVLIGVTLAGAVILRMAHQWQRFGWSAAGASAFTMLCIVSMLLFRSPTISFAIAFLLYLPLPLWTTIAFALVG